MALTIGAQKAHDGVPLTQEELADLGIVRDWKRASKSIGLEKGRVGEKLTSLERANRFIVESWELWLGWYGSQRVRINERLTQEELDNPHILEGAIVAWRGKGREKRELGFEPTQEERDNSYFMEGFNVDEYTARVFAAEVNQEVADWQSGRYMAEQGVPRFALAAQERNNSHFMNGFNSYLEERKVAQPLNPSHKGGSEI